MESMLWKGDKGTYYVFRRINVKKSITGRDLQAQKKKLISPFFDILILKHR